MEDDGKRLDRIEIESLMVGESVRSLAERYERQQREFDEFARETDQAILRAHDLIERLEAENAALRAELGRDPR